MRALAGFVMQGRSQAVLVTVLATGTFFLSWLAAAVIALVTLRRGVAEGGFLLLWALLPAAVLVWLGDTGPISTIVVSWCVATALRVTVSWPLALTAAVLAGLLVSAMLVSFGSAYLQTVIDWLRELLQRSAQPEVEALLPTAPLVAGLAGLSAAFVAVLSVMLGRWWQAVLYNPGGFRQEFVQLRLPPTLTLALVVAGLLLSTLSGGYQFWALIVAVPFMFAGFALVHGLVEARGLSSNWLIGFYCLWLLLDPLKALWMIVVVMDSWLDFRRMLRHSGNNE